MAVKPVNEPDDREQVVTQAEKPTDRKALSTHPEAKAANSGAADPHATTAYGEALPPCSSDPSGNPLLESTVPYSRPGLTSTAPMMMGRFKIIKWVGSGSFGAVFKAYDPNLKVERALKTPRKDLIKSGSLNPAAFYSEAQKLAKLNHPGIVKVLEVNKGEDDLPYVVSDYIAGGSLSEWITKHRPTPTASAKLVAAMADAVSYAHQMGIVHRDLKPANILMSDVTEDANPILVDFGLALSDAEFGRGSKMCGTYMYMSPEQAAGEAHLVDGRADVYSLGAILYEILTSKTPYRSSDPSTLRKEIVKGELRPLRQLNPSIPLELERICLKAMAKEPSQRYSTAADLATDLRQFVASKGVPSAATTSAKPQLITWIAAATILLAIAGAGAAWFLSKDGGGDNPIITPPPVVAVPDLEFHWQRAAEKGPFIKELMLSDLPLRKGDKVQFHAKLSAPEYVYIYWYGHDGKPNRLWPPDPNHQESVSTLVRPQQDNPVEENLWYALAQVGGPQASLIGVRRKPLSAEELQKFETNQLSLSSGLPEGKRLVEFQHPNLQNLTSRQRSTRSLEPTPVVSPKTALRDGLPDLDQWFDAYQGYVFATE